VIKGEECRSARTDVNKRRVVQIIYAHGRVSVERDGIFTLQRSPTRPLQLTCKSATLTSFDMNYSVRSIGFAAQRRVSRQSHRKLIVDSAPAATTLRAPSVRSSGKTNGALLPDVMRHGRRAQVYWQQRTRTGCVSRSTVDFECSVS
jgi:hypothetical protein